MSSWRTYILKALLGALALTAVAGVVGVVSSEDTMWRVCGTSVAGAVASLLMLWVSTLLDKPATRSAGLAGAIGVTLEFIVFSMLIWELHGLLPGDESELIGTACVVGVATAASMFFLRLLGAPATRIAAMAGLAVTAAACGMGMVATWWPGTVSWRVLEYLWVTAWLVGLVGLMGAAALVGVGTDRKHWRWLGVAAAAAAIAVAELDIWIGNPYTQENVLAPLIGVAAWVALAIPLLRIDLPAGQRWLRVATLVAGAATAGLWVFCVMDDFDTEPLMRAGAAGSILTGCGTLALAIIARLRRRVDAADLPREFRTITLYCPRCSKKQTQPLGAAACAACGLRIEVKAEQPACSECGYLLYGRSATCCPECGTPVARPAQAA